jgi:hypothetical protein
MQLCQLFIVTNGDLQMTRFDAHLSVFMGRVSSNLVDLCTNVLQDCGEIDRGFFINVFRIVSLFQETLYSTDGELETSEG